jgi:hypothetical protein
MAWCLVKHRNNFTFTFTFTLPIFNKLFKNAMKYECLGMTVKNSSCIKEEQIKFGECLI